ncbi:MAG: hypothetical protein AAGB51_07370 [Planctomycetota bacterium]
MRIVMTLVVAGLVGGCAQQGPGGASSSSASRATDSTPTLVQSQPVTTSAPEITTTPAPEQPEQQAQPIETLPENTQPEPDQQRSVALPTGAAAASDPPTWFQDDAWVVDGRLMVASSGQGDSVLEARRDAVRVGRAAFSLAAADRAVDPDSGVIIRTALVQRPSGGYRAYVLVAEPQSE